MLFHFCFGLCKVDNSHLSTSLICHASCRIFVWIRTEVARGLGWASASHRQKMVKRLEKEKSAMNAVNKYSREISQERQFTAKKISNIIDSLKKKGRQVYDQFHQQTSTGSEVLDVAAACRSWESFETFHHVFGGHPSCRFIAKDLRCH